MKKVNLLMAGIVLSMAAAAQRPASLLNPVEKAKLEIKNRAGAKHLKSGNVTLRSNLGNGINDYTDGVFFVNEDYYGTSNGTVNYLDGNGNWYYRVVRAENPGVELGCTSQYGAIYGGKFYICSKQEQDPGASVVGSRLAAFDAATLQLQGALTDIGGGDGRAFLGVDENTGYVGSSDGIWILNLNSMSITRQISGTENPNTDAYGSLYYGQTGTMIRVGNRVFAVHQNYGLVVIDASTHTVETTMLKPNEHNGNGLGSIVLSKDGNLWASVTADTIASGAAMGYIWKINPYTLEADTINFSTYDISDDGWIPNSWYAWTADAFCASTQSNKLYWIGYGGDSWQSNSSIYCFDLDADTIKKIYDVPDGWILYHAGFRVHPVTDDLYCFLNEGTSWSNSFKVVRLDSSGNFETEWELTQSLDNDGYWFPAIPVFPDNYAPQVSNAFPDSVTLTDASGFSLYLGDVVSDTDNLAAAIVKSVSGISDSTVANATIRNDSLFIKPIISGNTEDAASNVTVKFNSNGKIVEKTIAVTITANAANSAMTVQGIPRPDLVFENVEEEEEEEAELRFDQNFTFDDIQFWVGEGSNRAGLIVEWHDGKQPDALVWGYRWDGVATGKDMVEAVSKADPRLLFLIQETNLGYTIDGIGYAESGKFNLTYDLESVKAASTKNNKKGKINFWFDEPHTKGVKQKSVPENPEQEIADAIQRGYEEGIIYHPFNYSAYGYACYDYDYWYNTPYSPDDHWCSGWYHNGYWSYWVGDGPARLGYSGLGASKYRLFNNAWNAWSFASMKTMSGRKLGNKYTAATIPPQGISLDITNMRLTYGDAVAVTATVYPEDAEDKRCTWTSSNPSVAIVSGGVVQAVSPGTATITATTTVGSLKAACSVTVLQSGKDPQYNNNSVKAYRRIQILAADGVTTYPAAGVHYATGHKDFSFTASFADGEPQKVFATGYYSGNAIELEPTSIGSGVYKYTIRRVTQPQTVSFGSAANTGATGTEAVSTTKVWSNGSTLHISVADETEAEIYSITGSLVKVLRLPAGETLETLEKGVYIVKTNGEATKVVIR